MSKTKAVVHFMNYTDAGLAPVAQGIHDAMSGSAHFPSPPVSTATLQAATTNYSAALATKASRASADVVAFKAVRSTLEGMLGQLGGYVNQVAQGDAAIVVASGFPSYGTARPADASPPAAPANVRLSHGALSGSIIARYRPGRRRSNSEVQTCTGDPGVEGNWQHAGIFSGGKATVSGLTVGSTVWFRIRTAGIKGVMGEWSDPAKITVV